MGQSGLISGQVPEKYKNAFKAIFPEGQLMNSSWQQMISGAAKECLLWQQGWCQNDCLHTIHLKKSK